MKSKNFRVRFEDLPAFGEFVESSFLHDKDLFTAYSPVYANGFTEHFHKQLEAVRKIALPGIITGRMKKATQNQYKAQEDMLKLLGHIERYCQLAADELPFKIADLKLSELRTSLRKHDAEMAIVGARFVRESLQPGVAVMQEKGLEPRKIEELDRLMEDIRVQNIEQNELMNERRRQVEDNMNLMNDFWLLLQDLMRTGKLIHQDNPVRKAEYTEKNIRSRLRQVSSQKQEEANGKPPETPGPEEEPNKEVPVAA